MTVENARFGFVYVIEREDLKKCYVGQSVRSFRPKMHLKPGTYQYEELSADGTAPKVLTTEYIYEYGKELDEAEQAEMQRRLDDGWNLVNKLGPGVHWPVVPTEYQSAGGKRGGKAKVPKGFAVVAKLDFEGHKAASSKGALSGKAQRAADPEKMADFVRKVCQAGAATRRLKWETDPEWAAKQSERSRKAGAVGGKNGGKATARIRVKCGECDVVSTPGGLGSHQKSSGHAGRETLAS